MRRVGGMSGWGSVPGGLALLGNQEDMLEGARDDCLGDFLPATQLGCSWTPHGAKGQGTELVTRRREG